MSNEQTNSEPEAPVSTSITSSLYSKWVISPLKSLDSGSFIQKGIFYIFSFITILIGIYFIYILFADLFGSTGYFKKIGQFDTFLLIRSIILFIITFIITILAFSMIIGIFWQRDKDLKNYEYNGVVPFIFFKLSPWGIKTFGEAIAVIPITVGIINFFSYLLLALPYSPLDKFIYNFPKSKYLITNIFNNLYIQNFGDYISQLVNLGIIPLVIGVLASFFIILIFYFIAEFYLIVLNWIVHFSIPIKFRNKLNLENSNK